MVAEEIPFTQAAEIGTRKVINDHSTIGIVVTCDGSFSEIPRENYIPAEERTIQELKKIHKPFIVLVNSEKPYSEETKKLTNDIEKKYQVSAMAVNCEQLKKDDIHAIMENILYEFPLTMIEFYMPKWVEMLPNTHRMKADIIAQIKELMGHLSCVRDVAGNGLCWKAITYANAKWTGWIWPVDAYPYLSMWMIPIIMKCSATWSAKTLPENTSSYPS